MHIRHYFSIIFLSLICGACSSFGQNPETINTGSFEEARQAYSLYEHEKAYEIFTMVFNDEEQDLKLRAEAGRFLVKMDWRLYGRISSAFGHLKSLDQIDHDRNEAYLLRARILASEGSYDEASVACDKALELSVSELEKEKARLAYYTHLFAKVRDEIFEDCMNPESISHLAGVYSELQNRADLHQEDLDLMKLYLGYSLLLYKGEEAFGAWSLFYRLSNTEKAHSSLIEDVEAFRKAMNDYGEKGQGEVNLLTVIKGLAESGFYEYAALIKQRAYGEKKHLDSRINEIADYHAFLREMEKVCEESYRETVAGKTTVYSFGKRFDTAAKKLWNKLEWEGERPNYSQSKFGNEMKNRFKSIILFNTVSGHYGLHIGQMILDDRRLVSQYGQSAEFRYNVLDHMVSNGYTTWFSDGENSVGGWATSNGAFLQVRTGLNAELIKIWGILTDPMERKEMMEEIERLSRFEDDMARKDPYGFLPGLKFKLLIREGDDLLDSLQASGVANDQLRYHFIRAFEEIAEEAKIYAHEGRHSIDMKYGSASASKDLEYTAKLSEVYFSRMPLFFLVSLINANMGDGTAHGEANLKVIKGVVDWMNAHQEEISAFDSTRPTMPQIGKLTDAQVKLAVRSLDPLAN